MSSKKPASPKRATPPRACDYTKTFLKDWQRLSHAGRYDLKRLIVDHSLEQNAYGVRQRQPHGRQRFAGLRLGFFVHANVEHRGLGHGLDSPFCVIMYLH